MAVDDQGPALKEFGSFLGDFKSLAGLAGKLGILTPFADLLVNLGPPWPSRIGVEAIMCLVQFITLMWSFEFWWKDPASKKTVQGFMKRAVLFLVGLSLIYVFLFAFFVVDLPDMWHRDIAGFTYLPGQAELVKSNPTTYTDVELLERNERNPMKVWTGFSVKMMRAILLILWTTVWLSFSCALAAFVALQWRHVDRRKISP